MSSLRLLLGTALLLAGAPGAAAGPQASLKQAQPRDGICSFSGWSSDPDPRGLNVRAAPSPDARVVGRLPAAERTEEYDRPMAVTFDVVESRNGWFRIENARRWADGYQGPSRLPAGWVSGRYVDFALQTDIAFAEPNPSSRRVATSWRDRDGGGHFMRHRNPSACRGEWVRLMVAGMDGVERQAWVRGVCGNQETTCDGVRGDHIRHEDLPQQR